LLRKSLAHIFIRRQQRKRKKVYKDKRKSPRAERNRRNTATLRGKRAALEQLAAAALGC
jgi:hypothetical protein